MSASKHSQFESFVADDPQIELLAANKPRSTRFNDIYSSGDDPLGESEHVFLRGNRLAQRWRQAPGHSDVFNLGELGFGPGLNFLLTCLCWRQLPDRDPGWQHLHYVGYEQYPIGQHSLRQIQLGWTTEDATQQQELEALCKQLQAHWRLFMFTGLHRIQFGPDITLDLVIGDANQSLAERPCGSPAFDAWYLDGFSPNNNPGLWSNSILRLLAQHSHTGTTVATYSSAGQVRRDLQAVGFEVSREPGWKHKRHMLTGIYRETQSGPGSLHRFNKPTPGTVSIIGAGLAGCFAALALSRRGWRVTILDAGTDFGAGASGIPQLALRLRVFNQANYTAQLFLQAYLYSIRLFDQLEAKHGIGWHRCGIKQSSSAMNKRKPLNPEQLTRIYGGSLLEIEAGDSIWFGESGYLNPDRLCRLLCQQPGVSVRFNSDVRALDRHNSQWRCLDLNGEVLDTAETLILTSPQLIDSLAMINAVELEFTTGTSSRVEASPEIPSLDYVATGFRSVFPSQQQSHLVSATYERVRQEQASEAEANSQNVAALLGMLKLSADTPVRVLGSYQRERANTADRLPIVGNITGELAPSQLQSEDFENLFISSGHGSSGLATCPLSGELLAAQICGESLPLNQEQVDLLSPARFWQRQRKRLGLNDSGR